TVDIDPDVTDRASACLAKAGYHDVKVVCADAEHPVEPGSRYDPATPPAPHGGDSPACSSRLTCWRAMSLSSHSFPEPAG
ncbi:hypothetical protein EBO15_43130, partial [Actinomadura harenae]